MKIGIVVVAHNSEEYRTNGNKFITDFISSVNDSIKGYEYEIIVIDNESNPPLDLNNAYVLRVNNQSVYGLTGAWEKGIQAALNLNCSCIVINNDDIIYNGTINRFFDYIYAHDDRDNCIFGPVSNGILTGKQLSTKVTNDVHDLTNNKTNMLNGFMFAFTSNFYDKYKKPNGDLFNKEKYPWGGNEEEFQLRVWEKGARSLVVGHCFIEHHKIRGWKQHMKLK